MNRFNCPNCGSERTRSLPIIHASGTSTVRLTSIYVDTDEDIGVIPSYGKSQTAAARMAAPPAKKEAVTGGFVVWILLSGFFCFVGLFTFSINQSGGGDEAAQQMWAIGTAFCIWLASWIIPLIPRMQTAREYNENTLPKLIREWEQSFACERCGTIFRTEASEHATVARS